MALDIEEESSSRVGLNGLCLLHKFEKRVCRFVKSLVAINKVVYRNGLLDGIDF
jgi:hypothetical protein